MNRPYDFETISNYNTRVSPSTIHGIDSYTSAYYRKLLLKKAISRFKWNLPKHWDYDYFTNNLYVCGAVAVINTDRYGVIPQKCALTGLNVYQRPYRAIITNPLIKSTFNPIINEQCSLFYINPDYTGVYDIIAFYADQLALCSQLLAMNLSNSKHSIIYHCTSNSVANSIKKMVDKVQCGDIAVIADSALFTPSGNQNFMLFSQDLNKNYIADKVLDAQRSILNNFNTEFGINNPNTEKRERLITEEVSSNNAEVNYNALGFLYRFKKSCEQTNELFGTNISVELSEGGRNESNSYADLNSIVQS